MTRKGVAPCKCGHGNYKVIANRPWSISYVECCKCGQKRMTRAMRFADRCPADCDRHKGPDAEVQAST